MPRLVAPCPIASTKAAFLPLKRAIQTMIENPLAQKLLAGEFASGDTVAVDLEDDDLIFSKAYTH